MLVSRGAGLIEAEAGDEIVGLHVENGSFYRFSQTAARVWALIEQPRTLADLCAALTREFRVDPATCERDVRALLDDLATDGLVKFS
jgi:hypothetical protein